MVGPERPQIVLFGSSIVELSFGRHGWGAILADVYARKADILLRGYSGWNSRQALQVLHKVFPKDSAVQPALVVVYFGGNDSVKPNLGGLSPHVPLPEYVENMRKIAIHLESLSEKTRVIFLCAPPVNEAQVFKSFGDIGRTNERCQRYSDACMDLCREMDVKAVDLCSAFQKKDDWQTTCFTDGIHLSPEGNKVIVEELLKIIEEADWEPSLHWDSISTEFLEYLPHIIPNPLRSLK